MSHEKILVVDDEEPIVRLIKSILAEAGYRVITADGAASAKNIIAQQHDIDLLVTDINMPGESGLELVQHINEVQPETGVVVATIIDNPIEAEEILNAGVYGYIIKPFSKNLVLITIASALRRRELEMGMRASVENLNSRLHIILDNLHVGVLLINQSLEIIEYNSQVKRWFRDTDYQRSVSIIDNHHLSSEENIRCGALAAQVLEDGKPMKMLGRFRTGRIERDLQILMTSVCPVSGGENWAILMLEDQTERLLMERELHQSQKLEAIGQLAAGIAHEINTPTQYVGDNIHFFSEAYVDLTGLIEEYEALIRTFPKDISFADLERKIEDLREKADMDFLENEVPSTIEQSLVGISRVGSIVKAMREFSHPGTVEKAPTDINHLLESTVTVCRNEWKYVAETELNLDTNLPAVPCIAGEMNQVFLNLIINAAHAISSRVERGDYQKGLISISTFQQNGYVLITIQDNGGGISESIRYRVFDPFFTTKDIGKGTGQGLAIARTIVMEKHGGRLSFDAVKGGGTTFSIKLPIDSD